jgi:hypothetical protein
MWIRTQMVRQEWKGGGLLVLQSAISAFTWREWGKQWKTSVRTAGNLAKIRSSYILNRGLSVNATLTHSVLFVENELSLIFHA